MLVAHARTRLVARSWLQPCKPDAPHRHRAVTHWRGDALERTVWDLVTALLRNPDALLERVRTRRLTIDAERVDAAQEVATLQRQLEGVQRQRRRLLEYVDEQIDKTVFAERDHALDREEHRLADELTRAEARPAHGQPRHGGRMPRSAMPS